MKKILLLICLMLAILATLVILMPHGESAVTFSGNTIRIRGTNYLNTQTLINEIYALEMSTPWMVCEEYFEAPTTAPGDGEFGYIFPMDTGAFNRTQIWFEVDTDSTDAEITTYVTWSNGTKGTIVTPITGSDTLYFLTGSETITACNTSICTALNDGSYIDWQIWQFRRGMFGKWGSDRIAFQDTSLAIGQTATSVRVLFSNMTINWNCSGWYGQYYPLVMAGANSALGFKNCSVTFDDRAISMTSHCTISGTFKYLNATGCYFKSYRQNVFSGTSSTTCMLNFKDVICNGMGIQNFNVSLDNVLFQNYYSYALYSIKVRLATDVTIKNGDNAMAFSSTGYNVTNSAFKSNTYLIVAVGCLSNNYIIDCVADVLNINTPVTSFTGGKVNWAYTFKLRVKNESAPTANLSGVTVKVYNRTGALKYSGTTDANGQIPTQVLVDRYWDATHMSGYIENPYHLNLSKTGYDSQNITIYVSSPQNLTMGMKQSGCGSTALNIIEDLENCSGTAQTKYSFLSGWTVWNNYTGAPVLGRIEVHSYKATRQTYTMSGTTFKNVSDLNITVQPEPVMSAHFITWSGMLNCTSTADVYLSFYMDNVSMSSITRQVFTTDKEFCYQIVHPMMMSSSSHLLQCRVKTSAGTLWVKNSTVTIWTTWDNESQLPWNYTEEEDAQVTSSTTFVNISGTYGNITLLHASPVFIMQTMSAKVSNRAKTLTVGLKVDNVVIDSSVYDFESTDYHMFTKFYTTAVLSAGTHTIVSIWKTETATTATSQDIHTSAIAPIDNNNNVFAGDSSSLASATTTSTTMTNIGDVHNHITLTQPGYIFAFMDMLTDASTNNKKAYATIYINGTDMGLVDNNHISQLKHGTIAYATRSGLLPAGIYEVRAKWKTDSGNTLTGENIALFSFPSVVGTCPTCDSSALTLYENPVYCAGTHQSVYDPFTGWSVWANYSSALTKNQNIVNATGTHESNWDGSSWNVWANYTGTTTPITLLQNLGYAYGSHSSLLTSTGYKVWANYTSGLTAYENIINATGTHDSLWDGSSWLLWANYTGVTTPIHQAQNIVDAVGTHEYILNNTGYWDWANYTGTGGGITPINLFENTLNATGTHEYNLEAGEYNVWSNYTGVTTPLTLYENPVNATGTHVSMLTGSGYKVYANYTGLNGVNLFENLVNAVGTHEKKWTGTAWNVYANYSGVGTCPVGDLILLHNPNPGNGTIPPYNDNLVMLNPNGISVAVDILYTAFPDNLQINFWLYDHDMNLIDGDTAEDVTTNGTYSFHSNMINEANATYYWSCDIYSNYFETTIFTSPLYWFRTANVTLNVIEHLVNATGGYDSAYNTTTGWKMWNNYTGVTTPVTLHANPVNATGTLTKFLRSVGGWDVYANYTGVTTPISLYQNPNNATGTHTYTLTPSGYKVYANYTGLNGVSLFENLVNAVGTHEKKWTGTQWNIWANYTGTGGGTASFLMHNPNPGNGTLSYNYLRRNPSGLKTAVDIVAVSWVHPITLYWYSNTSGSWKLYATDSANANGTYQHLNVNMTNGSVKYWWRVVAKNFTGVTLENKTWSFETVKRELTAIPSTSSTVGMLVPLTSVGLIGCMLGVRKRRKTQ